jgi:hypothetical protein
MFWQVRRWSSCIVAIFTDSKRRSCSFWGNAYKKFSLCNQHTFYSKFIFGTCSTLSFKEKACLLWMEYINDWSPHTRAMEEFPSWRDNLRYMTQNLIYLKEKFPKHQVYRPQTSHSQWANLSLVPILLSPLLTARM